MFIELTMMNRFKFYVNVNDIFAMFNLVGEIGTKIIYRVKISSLDDDVEFVKETIEEILEKIKFASSK